MALEIKVSFVSILLKHGYNIHRFHFITLKFELFLTCAIFRRDDVSVLNVLYLGGMMSVFLM